MVSKVSGPMSGPRGVALRSCAMAEAAHKLVAFRLLRAPPTSSEVEDQIL